LSIFINHREQGVHGENYFLSANFAQTITDFYKQIIVNNSYKLAKICGQKNSKNGVANN
jgi:hypothetical protein